MNYLDIYNGIYSNADIEKKVVVACLQSADTIIHEDASTENHDLRMSWARSVISNPIQAARKMLPVIIVNPIVQSGTYADSDLLWLVQTNINAYALIL